MYLFRRFAMVALAFGVVAGYGSAFASFRHHRGACHGRWSEHDRWNGAESWNQRDFDGRDARAPVVTAPVEEAPPGRLHIEQLRRDAMAAAEAGLVIKLDDLT